MTDSPDTVKPVRAAGSAPQASPPTDFRPTAGDLRVSASVPRIVGLLRRVRAWMLVLPVDAAILLLPVTWEPGQWKATAVTTALFLMFMCSGGRYRARLHLSVLDDLPLPAGRLLIAAAMVATVIALRHEQQAVVNFLINVAISLGLLVAGRVVTTAIIDRSRRHRVTAHRTVVVGGGRLTADLAEILAKNPRYGLSVVGFVDNDEDCVADEAIPQLGKLADLETVVRLTRADVVLVSEGGFSERDLLEMVRTPACLPCDLLVVPRMHQFHTQTGLADHIGSIPIMRIRTPSLRGPARMVKRGFDLLVAGALLVLTSPIIALCALGVRIEGGKGVIFRQPRVGRDGVVFECLKLRSMRPASETESSTRWSVASDARLGPVGRILRRTSMDELPQLWNILRGDMTLVGPRPERPHFVHKFSEQFDRYAHRHRVQAGLTGFAQVSGLRGDTSIAERARYDNYYIENWTLWLDIKILLRTFSEILFARGR